MRHYITTFIGLVAPSAPQKATDKLAGKTAGAVTGRNKTIQLAPGQLWSGSLHTGQKVACQAGLIWLTQSDDATDHFMRPAQDFAAHHKGQIVVQAMEASVFTIQG